MRGHALLFGLNYAHCKKGKLKGCINDVQNVRSFLKKRYKIPVTLYTDRNNRKRTTRNGILQSLKKLARKSRRQKLRFVWIHYSGHGTWKKGKSGETDNRDELLAPSNYESGARITDNEIHRILKRFWKGTKIICVFDCCHSGTVADLKYRWNSKGSVKIENRRCRIRAKVACISGCLDAQQAADAKGINGQSGYSGAMTTYLLKALRNGSGDILGVLNRLKASLKADRFSQIPLLTSNFDVRKRRSILR